MSVSYTIALASAIASILFVFIGKIEHKGRKINLNWLILMIAIVLGCILTMVIIYHGQNDLKAEDIQVASASHTLPTNEEMEEWFSSTKEVIIGENEGGDKAVHIIDGQGNEWVLIADN